MKTLSKATFTSLAIGALFGLNACGQQLDAPEPELDAAAQQRAEFLELHTIALPDTPYSTGLRIYTHVHALDHELMQGALRTDTTLRFAKDADARLIDFKAGDVLVSSYDRGLFRTILRVEDQGDHLLFVTRQAELEEAIAQGKLHFHKMTEAAAQAQPGSPALPQDQGGLRTVSQGLGFKGDVEKSWDGIVKYNKDFKTEVNAKLHAMGVPSGAKFTKLGVDVNVGAELQADYDINVMPFKVDAGFTAKTNGVGVLDAQFEINTKDAKFNVEEEIYLFSTKNDNSPLVKLPAPSPLSLSLPLFPLTINFQAHGKLKALVSLDNGVNPENGEENPFIASGGARLTANLEAGLTGGLGRSWEPTFKATPNVEQIGPNFQGEKNFRAYAQLITSATVEVGEGLKTAATVVPLDAKVYLAQLINADTKYCPNELKVEAKGTATLNPVKISVKLPIVGTKSHDILKETISKSLYDTTLVNHRSLLDIPNICDPNAMPPGGEDNPTLVFSGRRAQCEGDAEDACGANTGLACFEQSCVTEAPLRISLAWYNSKADLDLIVVRPDGEAVFWRKRGDRDAGYYDFHSLDFNGVMFAGRPEVENFFAFAPTPGQYKVYVGRDATEGVEATNFKIQAYHGGKQVLNTGGSMGTGEGQYETGSWGSLPSFTVNVK